VNRVLAPEALNPEASGGNVQSRDAGTELFPVTPHHLPTLRPADRRRVAELAERIRDADPNISAIGWFGPSAHVGSGPFPTLHIHDSERAFGSPVAVVREHRALLLARQGDIVITGTPAVSGYVDYCRDDLNLGEVRCMTPVDAGRGRSLARRCIHDEEFIAGVARIAGNHGGLNISPYIGSGGIWALAAIIAARSGVSVWVSAPPPQLTRRVNNKIWFSKIAADLLGSDSLPATASAHGWSVLTHRVRECAKRNPSVGIKLPSEAGSAGNLVLDADDINRIPTLRALRTYLKAVFANLGWYEPFPTLVSVWEESVLGSPSIQMWIPKSSRESVIVEGIFDQKVQGRVGRFVGCEPSGLSGDLTDRLAYEGAMFGTLFQALGYYGRCSLDSILVGKTLESAVVHWVECNGRWGGTSIPMTLANRLVGDWTRRPFVVMGSLPVVGDASFSAIQSRMQGRVFRKEHGKGLVFLSPGPAETGRGLNLLAFAGSTRRARKLVNEAADLLASDSHQSASAS